MRLLLGLALGLALSAQPVAAAPKEEKKEQKAERKAARHPDPPAPAPAPAEEPTATEAKSQPKSKSRKHQPAPTPTASPSHTTVPAPAVTPAPVPSAAPVPAAPAPAPIAAPVARPHRRPARRERAPKPRHAVRGYSAAGARRAGFVPMATVLPPVLRPAPRPPAASRPARRPAAARQAERPTATPPVTAVTRVISVIPTPLRFLLAGLAMLVGLLALRARRLETQRRDLSDDLGLLQSALLPALPDRIGQAWVSAAYRPAEGLAAGGDFYDAFALDDHRACLLVGDVAGHGRDAIPLTADVRFTLRAYLEAGLGPRAALRATAHVMEPRLLGRFVTVVVAVLDSRSGRLTYATAGHPPPLLTGSEERLITAASCPALGTGLPTGLRQTTLTLPPGATACFYTDGLADALSGGRRLGPAGVAAHLAALGRRVDADKLLQRIVRESTAQPDDMAACLLRPQLGTAAAHEDRIEELELMHAEDDARARRFLRACGVGDHEAEAALEAAHDLLPVVLEVHCCADGATVAVHRPDTAGLLLT
jgi:hypothetical protein